MSLRIKCHSWNENYIYFLKIGKAFANRFHNVESTLAETITPRIAPQFHRFNIEHLRQENGLPLGNEIIEQLTGIHLIGQCIVGHNNIGIAYFLFQP